MKIVLFIGIGSFVGGVSRYLLSGLVQAKYGSIFPFGTMFVNIIGCFLIGIIYGWSVSGDLSDQWRLVLTAGLLGGFTTFSAFSLELIMMLQNNEFISAGLYLMISVIVGLVATLLGLTIMKFLL